MTEAFVPSMGQPRSDGQWWEDLGADTLRGLTMMVGGGPPVWEGVEDDVWEVEMGGIWKGCKDTD